MARFPNVLKQRGRDWCTNVAIAGENLSDRVGFRGTPQKSGLRETIQKGWRMVAKTNMISTWRCSIATTVGIISSVRLIRLGRAVLLFLLRPILAGRRFFALRRVTAVLRALALLGH
jgi:hypothetical protein